MGTIFFKSPIGVLKIESSDLGIKSITLCDEISQEIPDEYCTNAKIQLEEYFQGKRKIFNIPLDPDGTDFEKSVWKNLKTIPYGTTTNYGAIAREISTIKAVRAVGRANGKNPVPIIIPCHRVVGKDKSLIGFALGLSVKQFLLNLENPESWPFQTTLDL